MTAAIMRYLSRAGFLLQIIQLLALYFTSITSLKHHLVLTKDHRFQVSVSSFGYNLLGRLEAIVQNVTLDPDPMEDADVPQYGFVIIKSNQARNPYAARPNQQVSQTSCLLNDPRNQFNFDLMVLSILPDEKKVSVKCTGNDLAFPKIQTLSNDPSQKGSPAHSSYKHQYTKRAVTSASSVSKENDAPSSGDFLSAMIASKDDAIPESRHGKRSNLFHDCPNSPIYLPLEYTTDLMGRRSYSFNFSFVISDVHQEGNYYISFHNCRGFHNFPYIRPEEPIHNPYTTTKFNLSMLIFETNYPENFLSAGAMPLPQMYFMLSVMFFLSGCIWINFISRQKDSILKIHNLMTVLIFAKAFSLLFHGINYHYIALDGQPVVTWAYLYYATRAVKGALFFITLALIGSGWTFVKHILSPRDKYMIIVIVGLQVIAHIAEILLDQSTEGEASIEFWWQLCGLVDLFSCIFILLPITWSVRHLECASRTDGKAAINLKKLELFKSFYIISTIYIYVTRIMTFVFLSMLSFKYSWLSELFSELATLIYFIVTGNYFQPIPSNPYLLLSSDPDMEEDILFSVDAHEMNGMPSNDLTSRHTSTGHDNDGTKAIKRRAVEQLV